MAWDDTFGAMEDSFPAEVLTLEDIVEEITQEETMGKKTLPLGEISPKMWVLSLQKIGSDTDSPSICCGNWLTWTT